ncbi:MAG: HDIG domain-containing protein [Candidatus Viridilinea halotolerans]|uniref:HDIG domain-containing protein n=1 Tax=Candidatus Viridilinea halotolerans TaxID=2491704 RepID=A0A426U7W7_9CHLR|nr:MAG: HDIG domain-containing protein [Candidatus Viridilinea halotolerans]
MSTQTTRARATLYEWVQAESLRKHCEAVAACMVHFARKTGADEDLWGAVGLLHDMDFERYPDMPAEGPATTALAEALIAGEPVPATLPGHPFYGVAYVREAGWGTEVVRAILSHADYSGIAPASPMERTLYAVDELSGFVTAVALVRPDKNIASVEVASVKKKFKDKAFAAKVSRPGMHHGAEVIGMNLDDLIAEVIAALRAEAPRLGIGGGS